MPKLWKTTIEIYSDDESVQLMNLEEIARDACSGNSLCTKQITEPVEGFVPGVSDHDLFMTDEEEE